MSKPSILDQGIYDAERRERRLWEVRRSLNLSRREWMRYLGAAAGAAAGTRLGGVAGVAHADHTAVVKSTPESLFYIHGSNRETRFEAMASQGYVTPNSLFYVRNHTRTPHVDPGAFRLRVEGTGVSRPVEFTYDELLAMESRTETRFVECAGNFRSQFADALGRRASGTQWRTGAIGVAEWTGVPLCALLDRAGLKRTAVDGMAEGLDAPIITSSGENQGHVRRPVPVEKLLQEDTLLAYGMNGETLPPDHGFPVRLLTPGWVGICNIKWVGRIEVSETPLFSPWNTTSYVMFGEDYPHHPIVTNHMVKSAFELPWGGTIAAGEHQLTGRSWSGLGRIDHVDVSFDDGVTWQAANMHGRNEEMAWARWSVEWDATPGSYRLRARAADDKGNVQPVSVPYNEQGYLYWAVTEHPITVA